MKLVRKGPGKKTRSSKLVTSVPSRSLNVTPGMVKTRHDYEALLQNEVHNSILIERVQVCQIEFTSIDVGQQAQVTPNHR